MQHSDELLRVKMSFDNYFEPYIRKFSAFGVTLHQPNAEKSFCAKIPVLIYALISITAPGYCAFQLITNDRLFQYFGLMELVILAVAAVGDVMRGVFHMVHAFSYESKLSKAWTTFRNLEPYFETHLDHRLSYQMFRRRFANKMLVVLGTYVLLIIAYILKNISTKIVSELSVPKRLMQISNALSTVYIVFHVDILSCFLTNLNAVIKRDVNNELNQQFTFNKLAIVNKLKNYKIVHFRLWLISQWLSSTFGWHLLFIVLSAFADCVYSAFWLFEELNRDAGIFAKLRK